MTKPGFNVAISEQDLVVLEYRAGETDFRATMTAEAAKELGKTLHSRGEKARAAKTTNTETVVKE